MKTTHKNKNAPITNVTDLFNVVHAYDRITLYLNQPALPIQKILLQKHCSKVEVTCKYMVKNPRWKLKVELFQPTIKCIRLLNAALSNNVTACITYVEIARDLQANSLEQSVNWCNEFLASATMKYQHQKVNCYKGTWYFGRRTDVAGNKRGHVLAVYADKPSKLNNACLTANSTPCLHIEWRATGSKELCRFGIVTLTDLIAFDHAQFWNDNITIFQSPKPAELGKLLAEIDGADTDVSGTALRNRTKRWRLKNSTEDQFVMHNGLLLTPRPFIILCNCH